MPRVSGRRAYSGQTASTGGATTTAAIQKLSMALSRTPNSTRPLTVQDPAHQLKQPPSLVARGTRDMLVGFAGYGVSDATACLSQGER